MHQAGGFKKPVSVRALLKVQAVAMRAPERETDTKMRADMFERPPAFYRRIVGGIGRDTTAILRRETLPG